MNAGPGLLMHLKPAVGRAQPVGDAIVNHLFPPGQSGRIPIVGLLGAGESSLAARLIASMLQLHGWQTALACRDGLFLGPRQLSKTDARRYAEAFESAMKSNRGTAGLKKMGITTEDMRLATFQEFVESENSKFGFLIKTAKIRIE